MLRTLLIRSITDQELPPTMPGYDRLSTDLPAARAKLAHPDGEFCLLRGAARAGIPYCMSSVSSIGHKELSDCLRAGRRFDEEGCFFFQLYAGVDRALTEERIRVAIDNGFKALVLAVDSAVVAKREENEKHQAEVEYLNTGRELETAVWIKQVDNPTLSVLRGHHSSTLAWEDLKWIRELWGNTGPIALKGIQTVEDAVLAVEAGIDAIYLSNHSGRQCDKAPSAIRTLVEIRRFAPGRAYNAAPRDKLIDQVHEKLHQQDRMVLPGPSPDRLPDFCSLEVG